MRFSALIERHQEKLTAAELAGAKALGMTTIAFNRDDETVEADHIISRFSELPEVLERGAS